MKSLVLVTLAFLILSASAHSGNFGPVPHLAGGDVVRPLDRPYTVGLRLSVDKQVYGYCGGSRISDEWIITAAECLDRSKYNRVQIRYLYPHGYDEKEWYFKDLIYKIHPKYNKDTKENNIAVIFCGACYDGVPMRNPRLPGIKEKNETFANQPAVVSGYEITYDSNKEDYYYVTSAETTILKPWWCKVLYFFRTVRDDHICTSGWGGKSLSKYDVGAPLVIRWGPAHKPFFKILGVGTSIRPWTTVFSQPMVFTRVSLYSAWIRDVTKIIVYD